MDGQRLSRCELQKLQMSLVDRMGHMSGDQAGEGEAEVERQLATLWALRVC